MDTEKYHEPVMVEEVLRYLAPQRGGLYLDGTLGGGGHTEAILSRGPDARVLGIDRDPDALAAARERLAARADRVRLERGNYEEAAEIFDLGEGTLAGVLLDLGVSSHQIDSLDRGFSFRSGAPLDMRMSPKDGGSTAADLLNRETPEELTRILKEYGEEPRARSLARLIAERRREEPFATSDDLVAVCRRVLGSSMGPSDLARIFQALRIAVNDELRALEEALPVLRDCLVTGGRMVVIAYHSLEDRIVKRAFREWSRSCICPPRLPVCRCRGRPLGRALTRRPERPTGAEVERNPRARSARLRAWERGE